MQKTPLNTFLNLTVKRNLNSPIEIYYSPRVQNALSATANTLDACLKKSSTELYNWKTDLRREIRLAIRDLKTSDAVQLGQLIWVNSPAWAQKAALWFIKKHLYSNLTAFIFNVTTKSAGAILEFYNFVKYVYQHCDTSANLLSLTHLTCRYTTYVCLKSLIVLETIATAKYYLPFIKASAFFKEFIDPMIVFLTPSDSVDLSFGEYMGTLGEFSNATLTSVSNLTHAIGNPVGYVLQTTVDTYETIAGSIYAAYSFIAATAQYYLDAITTAISDLLYALSAPIRYVIASALYVYETVVGTVYAVYNFIVGFPQYCIDTILSVISNLLYILSYPIRYSIECALNAYETVVGAFYAVYNCIATTLQYYFDATIAAVYNFLYTLSAPIRYVIECTLYAYETVANAFYAVYNLIAETWEYCIDTAMTVMSDLFCALSASIHYGFKCIPLILNFALQTLWTILITPVICLTQTVYTAISTMLSYYFHIPTMLAIQTFDNTLLAFEEAFITCVLPVIAFLGIANMIWHLPNEFWNPIEEAILSLIKHPVLSGQNVVGKIKAFCDKMKATVAIIKQKRPPLETTNDIIGVISGGNLKMEVKLALGALTSYLLAFTLSLLEAAGYTAPVLMYLTCIWMSVVLALSVVIEKIKMRAAA